MQTAPFAPTSIANPTPIHVADVAIGQPFVTRNDFSLVYALLSHQDVDTADCARRWCVVVAARAESPQRLGAIVPMLAQSSVYAVTVLKPAVYSVA